MKCDIFSVIISIVISLISAFISKASVHDFFIMSVTIVFIYVSLKQRLLPSNIVCKLTLSLQFIFEVGKKKHKMSLEFMYYFKNDVVKYLFCIFLWVMS